MVSCWFHCSQIKVKKHLKAATKSTFFSWLSANKICPFWLIYTHVEHHCSTRPTKMLTDVTTWVHLFDLTNKTTWHMFGDKINCRAYLWIRGPPVSVVSVILLLESKAIKVNKPEYSPDLESKSFVMERGGFLFRALVNYLTLPSRWFLFLIKKCFSMNFHILLKPELR